MKRVSAMPGLAAVQQAAAGRSEPRRPAQGGRNRPDPRAVRAVGQLASLMEAPGVPPSVRDLCAQVAERLSAPIRLSLVGLETADPVDLANGLLGGALLPRIDGLPPADIAFASTSRWQAVTVAGDVVDLDPADLHACDPYELALLRRWAPVPLLQQVSLRVTAIEESDDGALDALRWATHPAEMLVWCSDGSAEDSVLRQCLPEALLDHAFMALRASADIARRGGDGRRPAPVPPGAEQFLSVVSLGTQPEDGRAVADLRLRILSHLARGRREDLDFALMMLEQYQPRRTGRRLDRGRRPAGPGQGAPKHADAPPVDVPRAAPRPPQRPAKESDPRVSRLADLGKAMRSRSLPAPEVDKPAPDAAQGHASAAGRRAEGAGLDRPGAALSDPRPRPASADAPMPDAPMAGAPTPAAPMADAPMPGAQEPDAPMDGSPEVLQTLAVAIAGRLGEAADRLSAHATSADADTILAMCADCLSDAAELCDDAADDSVDTFRQTVSEAADLALLIQLEGSLSAAADGVALMVQVRRTCEAVLSA